MAIQEHRDGKVNINRFQNILADIYTLAGGGSTFADKDKNGKLKGSMPAWGIPLAIAGDVIAAKAIQTGNTGYMSTEDFYNFDNWKGFAGELAEDWSRWVYDWLPDSLNPWKQLNRDGKYRVYDPITLDLNGDGIHALAANGFAGALFDHDNDGIRTATGWVNKEDGLLVRDLNGNGIIDNGSELFGDNTALADGSKAAHGYVALAELDSNSDGKVDASDKAFNELKVWIDANSDGISQASELRTLMDLDIQSLDVAYKDVNQNLGNGNSIQQLGSYTKTDGSTAQMGDAWFAADKLYSRFIDKIDMTAEQAQAANLSGIGRLRDLREAAALSPNLAHILKAYSQADSKATQQALLPELINEWAKTDPQYGGGIRFLAPYIRTANEGIAITPSQERDLLKALPAIPQEWIDKVNAALEKIYALDAFTGEKSNVIYITSNQDILDFYHATKDTFQALSDNIYQSLLLQTRLQPYVSEIGFKLENNEFKLDFSGVTAAFGEVYTQNPEKAFVDLSDLLAYQPKLAEQWKEGAALWAAYLYEAEQQGVDSAYLAQVGNDTVQKLGYRVGTAGDDTLSGHEKMDVLLGREGNDKLYASSGNDILIGGTGNDTLSGGSGADSYIFAKGHGQDVVYEGGSNNEKDSLQLTDITLAETKFRKVDNDLVLFGYHEGDSITVKDFFSNSYYEIEQFAFKDQTIVKPNFSQHLNAANNMIQAMSVFGAETMDNGMAEVLSTVPINPLLSSSVL